METNKFSHSFSSKTNEELISIAENAKSFRLEARYSAVLVLKSREFQSSKLEIIALEIEKLIQQEQKLKADIQITREIIEKKLKLISIKKTQTFTLKHHAQLKIYRVNNRIFQIRMANTNKSEMMPVIIGILKKNGDIKFYPFFQIKTLTFIIFCSLFILGFLKLFNVLDFEFNKFYFLIVIACFVFLQIISMPFTYHFILNNLEEKLGENSK
jgi:hypothetical protein